MVVHVRTRVEFDYKRRLFDHHVTHATLNRIFLHRFEQLQLRVPGLQRRLLITLFLEADRVKFAMATYLARLEGVLSVVVDRLRDVQICKVEVDVFASTQSHMINALKTTVTGFLGRSVGSHAFRVFFDVAKVALLPESFQLIVFGACL